MRKRKKDKTFNIHAIENADKNPKEVLSWVNDVADHHKRK